MFSPKQTFGHKKRASPFGETLQIHSRQRVTLPPRDVAVPSPLESLTAVFGMGTGGSSPLLSPGNLRFSYVRGVSERKSYSFGLAKLAAFRQNFPVRR